MIAVLEGGEWSAARPGRTLSPGKDPVPIVQEAISASSWFHYNKNFMQFLRQCHKSAWYGVAQSGQRVTTGWTVRGSNPGGGERPTLGRTQPPIQWVPGLSRGLSDRGVALTTHPI